MLDALFKAFGQAMKDQLALAEHRMFIGTLFAGSEDAALVRLRERVRALDEAQFGAFMQAAQTMLLEAQTQLQQVEANGGNDAWGGSFEDRMAFMTAQIQTGDRSASNQRMQQAQVAVQGMMRVVELSEHFRAEREAPQPQPQPATAQVAGDAAIEAMLDEVARTGRMPDGLMEALSQVKDPVLLERLVGKLKDMGGEAAGDRPLDDIKDYYREGAEPYELLWPLPANLIPMPFEELDRPTQFHVLFAECKRRLMEGGALRNGGSLDAADAAFNECLQRADQLEVPILKSDAYQGLLSVAERRGDRAAAKRYTQLAMRERDRQGALPAS